jgi:hydroxyacylglutathione hydrolase
MPQEIKTISLPLPYRLGSMNCYLVETGTGYVLIDTGCSNRHAELVEDLESAGCTPGRLDLVVLTHGDFDHAGNAAYLRERFGTKVAMHRDDAEMVERGDMFCNRRNANILIRVVSPMLSALFGFGKSERFQPDLFIEDGYDLSEYGFDAQVLHIPGHSRGSVGILTAGGDLFCGDLLNSTDKPALNSIIDDLAAANASVARLRSLGVNTVYPGHGRPFSLEEL